MQSIRYQSLSKKTVFQEWSVSDSLENSVSGVVPKPFAYPEIILHGIPASLKHNLAKIYTVSTIIYKIHRYINK